jgi:hypothetical protein
MGTLPTVRIGHTDVTRLIPGSNTLVGNSHRNTKLDREMAEYFTPERVVSFLHECQAAGINTALLRGDYHRVLHWLELFRREGGQLNWIAQTAPEMHDVFSNIRIIAAGGGGACYYHGGKTDNLWLEGKIDRVKDYIAAIRDAGMSPGLGTHIPEVIEYAHERQWDVDFYMACLHNLSHQQRESAVATGLGSGDEDHLFANGDADRQAMCKVIRAVDKPCIAFKILGAGRRCETQADVRDAFGWTFANIKPTDAVCVGFFPKHSDQVAQNVSYTLDAIEAAMPQS